MNDQYNHRKFDAALKEAQNIENAFLRHRRRMRNQKGSLEEPAITIGTGISKKQKLVENSQIFDLKVGREHLFIAKEDNTIQIQLIQKDNLFEKKQTLEGHSNGVYCIAISDDEYWLFSGGGDSSIIVWQRNQNGLFDNFQVLTGHTSFVNCLAVSRDSQYLYSGGQDRTIRVFIRQERGEFKQEQVIAANNAHQLSLALSNDLALLISGGGERIITLWRKLEDHQYSQAQILEGHTSSVSSLALSNDMKFIFSGGYDKRLIVWIEPHDQTYQLNQVIEEHTNWIFSLALSDDYKWLFSASRDQTIRVFQKLSNNQFLTNQVLEDEPESVRSVALSKDNHTIFGVVGDESVQVWEIQHDLIEEKTRVLKGHNGNILCLTVSKDQRWIYSGADDEDIIVWEIQTDYSFKIFQILRGHKTYVFALALSKDTNFLFSGGYESTIRIWERQLDGYYKQIHSLEGHSMSIRSIVLSIDENILVSGGFDQKVLVWQKQNNNSYSQVEVLEQQKDTVNSIALSSDKCYIFSGGDDKKIIVYEKKDRMYSPFQTLNDHAESINSVKLSSDDKWLYSGGEDKLIRVYERQHNRKYKQMRLFKGHLSSIYSLSLSADERTLYSGDSKSSIFSWHLSCPTPTPSLLPSPSPAKSQIFALNSLSESSFPGVQIERCSSAPYLLSSSEGGLLLFFSAAPASYFFSGLFYLPFFSPLLEKGVEEVGRLARAEGAEEQAWELAAIANYPEGVRAPFPTQNSHTKHVELLGRKNMLEGGGNPDVLKAYAEVWNQRDEGGEVVAEEIGEILGCCYDMLKIVACNKLLPRTKADGIELPELFQLPNDEEFVSLSLESEWIRSHDIENLKNSASESDNLVDVEFITSATPLDLRLTSDFATNLIQGLAQCSTEIQMSDFRFIIRKIFLENKYMFWIQSITHWICIVSLVLIIIWGKEEWFFYLQIFVFYTIFICFEIIIMISNPKRYISNLYNWIDLPLYLIGLLLVLFSLVKDREFLKNTFINFLVMLYFSMAIFRSITMLRVMDSCRYMIEMTVASFKEMRYFLLIMALFILGIGVLRNILNIPDNEFSGSFEEFWRVSDLIYNWGYGNWDNSSEMTWNVYLLYIFTSIFLSLVMMNMLIAIISQTFEQYSGNRSKEDTKQTIQMLSEMNSFIRVFYSPKSSHLTSKHLHIIKHKEVIEVSADDLRQKIDNLDEAMKKEIYLLTQEVRGNRNDMREIVSSLRDDIISRIDTRIDPSTVKLR